MIRDKIAFYSNSEDLDLRCLGCNIRTHLIHNCSKVHYTPDRDFIISRYLYNSPTKDRQQFYRRNRERYHTLAQFKKLEKISIFFLNLTSAKETDHDNDTIELEEEGGQPQLYYQDSNEERKVWKKKSEETLSFLEDNEYKSSSFRTPPANPFINEFNSNLSSSLDRRISSFEKKEGLYNNMNINLKYSKNSDIANSNINNSNNNNNNKNEGVKHTLELFMYDFDRVNSYFTYFPENNLEHVLSIIKMRSVGKAQRFKTMPRQISLNIMRFPLSTRVIISKQNSKVNSNSKGGGSPTMKDYGKLSFFNSMKVK